MSWLHFSSILEPYNHTRRVIGFDTFTGFPELHEKDVQHSSSKHLYQGAFNINSSVVAEINNLIALHDRNRPLGHIPKAELVVGNACETIPQYIKEHPHLLVSLLYLDFDIYEPTKACLEAILPHLTKGAVIGFDEINFHDFPGETMAFNEVLGINKYKIYKRSIRNDSVI